ncbi:MAG: hypothetical protein LQ352_002716 [Teloschistes flavicans]|nr:MAG: hypothetical protein LQ352_002716 [Teloschistes flavicans]
MSFRKRNVGLSGPSSQVQIAGSEGQNTSTPGVRPSPLDGRLITSTGASSLDDLLGHAGFALGNSILIEEDGTTEFGTTLLRYFAAEGVIQGHKVHVVGVGEPWGKELPGVAASAGEEKSRGKSSTEAHKERMKIAWRYERLGEFGAGPPSARGGTPSILSSANASPPAVNRIPAIDFPGERNPTVPTPFCHTFDLTKRLAVTDPKALNFIPVRPVPVEKSPFEQILQTTREQLASFPKTTLHRLIIPSLLSPAFYPPHASSPQHVLQFLHSLRAILRQYPTQLVAMISLPLMLYPRSAGLTTWMELLSDGVIELSPFPHPVDAGPSTTAGGATTTHEEKPQGIVKVHRLPVFSEKGGGGVSGDDLVFIVSRRKFLIKPFNLPPVEGDLEAQRGEGDGKPTNIDIEF